MWHLPHPHIFGTPPTGGQASPPSLQVPPPSGHPLPLIWWGFCCGRFQDPAMARLDLQAISAQLNMEGLLRALLQSIHLLLSVCWDELGESPQADPQCPQRTLIHRPRWAAAGLEALSLERSLSGVGWMCLASDEHALLVCKGSA